MLVTEEQPISLSWIPDTGSDIDAIGVAQLSALGGFVENMAVDCGYVCGENGQRLRSAGKICAILSVGTASCDSTIHDYEGLIDALLSK